MLSKQIELLAQFESALVQRDFGIGQLELLLAKTRVFDELMGPEVENVLTPPPPPASHPLSPLISAETVGLYQDGWTGTRARLSFHPSPGIGKYLISFWLPAHAVAKSLFVTPDYGGRTELELWPSKTVIYRLRSPSDALSPAGLTLETSKTDAPGAADRRALGVFLLGVVWNECALQIAETFWSALSPSPSG